MEGQYIEIEYEDQAIKGIIKQRQQFFLEVVITHPYIAWSESISIPSYAKPNPIHYLTERGEEVAKDLLLTCYLKMRELDRRWSAIVKMRNELKHALGEIKANCSAESFKTAESVFQEFWEEFVFLNDDELVLSVGQDYQLDLMVEFYNETGKQFFKK